MRNEKGMTLVEVIIALGILGVIVITFLSGMSVGSRTLAVGDELATAESIARSEMEYVKKQDYYQAPWSYVVSTTPITPPWGGDSHSLSDDYANYTANVTAELVHITDDGIQKIIITVYHNGEPMTTVGNSTLEGYKGTR
jgi:prepilin-type N-terminal cleavage/methylation domain-containing protein